MEKPFVALSKMPLAAPIDEMEDIVIATLNGMQFSKCNYIESPKTIQATKEKRNFEGDHSYNSAFAVEFVWYEDAEPPAEFESLSIKNEFIQPIRVTLKVKDLEAQDQSDAQSLAKVLWGQLKERAELSSEAAKTKKKPTDHGSASWATLQELTHEGYVQDEHPEEPSTRLLIGSYKHKTISVPRKFTEAHAIVAGPPGVGKSRTIFIPNLIERIGTSALVTEVVAGEDIKPTVFRMTAGYRQAKGHKVFYLNPADLDNSTRFNPIDFISGIDDAIYYANLIIQNTTEKKHIGDQIWTQSETHLLTALLLYAWGLGGKKKSVEGGMANLGHIRELLRHGPINLDKLINSNGIPDARNRFSEFIRNSSPNFRLGVFSGLIQRLNSWLNPKIVKLTEVSDFTEEDLRDNLFTFYLAFPVNRADYKPIMALALNFLTKLALRKSFQKPLTLLLDEFAAYGTVTGIDDLQATIRNKGIGIVLGFQDQEQLEKSYSKHEANVLFTNTDTKVLFATGSALAQKQISSLLGQETRVKKIISSSCQISRQTFGSPLLLPGEIGTRIKDGQVLVIRNKRNPVIVETCDSGKYNAYETTYPAPQKTKKHVDPSIFDQVELAAQLEFSQEEADAQMSTYETLWNAKTEAQNTLLAAKEQGVSPQAIKSLEKALEKAQEAYDKFVAPEGPGAIPTDYEDKELVWKNKQKPKPMPKPAPKDNVVVEEEVDANGVIVKPKPDPKPNPPEPKPVKTDPPAEEVDPFSEFYDTKTTTSDDPYQDFYDNKDS